LRPLGALCSLTDWDSKEEKTQRSDENKNPSKIDMLKTEKDSGSRIMEIQRPRRKIPHRVCAGPVKQNALRTQEK
jgi:hypothetical protein